jgi:hypothetical protein
MLIRDFKPIRKNTLLGFFTLVLDSGLVIKECSLHEKENKRWLSFPGKPQLDKDGKAMRDERGKVIYANILIVEDWTRSAKLQELVLEALAPHLVESFA